MRHHLKPFQTHPIAGCLARLGQRRGFLPLLAGVLPGLALAELPGGGVVVGGASSATISYPDANRMAVNQVVDRSIINWQSFSVGSGNYVQFIQPSSSAIVLNRVVGGSPSDILGSMSANGQVFLVNPNGVFFGAGASIDVAGLVATTLNIRDQDFLAGNYVFSRDASSPAVAKVTNAGVIAARDGGYVVLAGDYAANTGIVQARLGTIAMAAGNKLTLDLQGDQLVNFVVNEKTLTNLAGVANAGQLLADGGRIVMTAAVAGDLAATVINNSGLVQAQSMVEHGGEIYLAADGGSIRMSGTLDASAQPGANGGHVGIVATGGDTTIADGALIKVSGNDIAVSNAGTAYLWADGITRFEKGARIEARGGAQGGDGGFIEVSGNKVAFRGQVDARAPKGKRGTLLIDPNQIDIANGTGTDSTDGATIYEQNLEGLLQAGGADVVLEATGFNASITLANLTDGILDGRNAGLGGGLELRVNGSGAPAITFANTANTIAVDGNLTIGHTSSGVIAPTVSVGNLIAKNITIGTSSHRIAEISVGAMTATPQGSGDTTTTNINLFADGNINLNGPISVRSNASGSSAAYLKVRTTGAGGNIVHATGASNAIAVGGASSNAGAAAEFTADGGTISLGHVSALSGNNKATISINGDQGVTLAGPLAVQGRGSSYSSTGARLEVYANNGNINHTSGHIQVTNTAGSSSGGGANACFVAGGGNCSGGGSGGTGTARTISLGKVSVTADSGWAKIGVNATGSITLSDDVTAQGRYSAGIRMDTLSSAASITLADASKTIKANMTDASSGSGGSIYINANNGTVDLAAAVVAYGAGSNFNGVNIQGGTITVGSITAGNASPTVNSHLGQVNIQSQSGAITLNGPITVTGNSNSGSGASLYVRSAQNINHAAGSATAINVRNYFGGGGAKAEFHAIGTATIGKVSVQGYEGAQLAISALGGISVADDLTVTADGGGARIQLYRDSGGSAGSIPISLATGKFIRAIATAAPSGSATIDINGNGGGPGDTISILGTLVAQGGAGTSSGQASIQVSGGNVTLGTVTATAGNSAQITVQGTDITLNGNLTAANSIQLSPNYNSATGNITGNGHNLATDKLMVFGGNGGGTFDLTTNAANIEIYGGNSITVNAAGQTGTLSARLGCSSGSGAWVCGGPGAAIGNVAITAGGTLEITQLYTTTGTTHFLRADTLTLPGTLFMPAAAAVTLTPYTVTNVVGVHSATDTDATIQTNYDLTSWGALFPAGTTLTIGGTTGGLTGDIHVGADGVVDIGDKNLVLSTASNIVAHNLPTTTGIITQILAPVVVVPPAPPPAPPPEIPPEIPPDATNETEEVGQTIGNLVSGLGSTPGGGAGSGDAGNSVNGLVDIGAPPGGPPPVFQIQGDGLNLFASGPNNGPGAPDGELRRR